MVGMGGWVGDGDLANSEWSYPLHMTGTATPSAPEEQDDVVKRLHAVVEEVTGRPVDVPPRQRIGFY